jgi:excisionase family DNA binding protein
MTGRSGRGRWERVLAARRQAREALGDGPEGGDLYAEPPKAKTASPKLPAPVPIQFTPRPSEAIGVLSIGEAAVRLGMSRTQLEAMIDVGKVEALPTGFTRMIPTREVERLAGGTPGP